ncbi:Retrovirus-related Pol polyprotein from transposon opus, partial [Mucuna pruriens]
MTTIFSYLREKCVEICIDDFSVFGPSFDKCLCNINWGKCQFMVLECIILQRDRGRPRQGGGHYKATPTCAFKVVRSFLGYTSFYRIFVKDFSKIAKPMTNLLAKDMEFEFSYACFKAFELLKEKLTCAPVVATLDWTSPFELMYDASDTIVGAMLGQRKDKMFHTIYYFSCTLNESQQNYTTREKRNCWQLHYLVLSEAIVYIGHCAIKFLLENQDTKPR